MHRLAGVPTLERTGGRGMELDERVSRLLSSAAPDYRQDHYEGCCRSGECRPAPKEDATGQLLRAVTWSGYTDDDEDDD